MCTYASFVSFYRVIVLLSIRCHVLVACKLPWVQAILLLLIGSRVPFSCARLQAPRDVFLRQCLVAFHTLRDCCCRGGKMYCTCRFLTGAERNSADKRLTMKVNFRYSLVVSSCRLPLPHPLNISISDYWIAGFCCATCSTLHTCWPWSSCFGLDLLQTACIFSKWFADLVTPAGLHRHGRVRVSTATMTSCWACLWMRYACRWVLFSRWGDHHTFCFHSHAPKESANEPKFQSMVIVS